MSHTDARPSALDQLTRRLTEHAEVLFADDGERTARLVAGLIELAERYRPLLAGPRPAMDQATAYLIAYGDSFRRPGQRPLVTLADVVRHHLADTVSDVHLLPIFPWTSDDGFAVVDYRRIDPDLGTGRTWPRSDAGTPSCSTSWPTTPPRPAPGSPDGWQVRSGIATTT